MMKHKMKKTLIFSVLAFMYLGCDTSYKMDKAPEAPLEKTACTVDFSKTCWVETVQQITSCLGEDREGTFSADKKFCTNTQQMLIDIADPVAMLARPYDVVSSPIDFRVLSNSIDECFRIQGTRSDFVITVAATGAQVHFVNDGNQIRFNCLDGQEIMVDHKNVEGCSGKLGPDSIPGLSLETWKEQKADVGWQLDLRGAGQEPVFRCRF